MARADFGGTIADYATTSSPSGALKLSSATLTFWSAQTGGTQYTDLLLAGQPASVITVGSNGQIPQFQGPDAITAMWADAGSTRVLMISATDVAAQAASALASAAAAAASAAAADAVPVAADKIVYVSTRGNDSNTGLTWKAALLTVQAAITKLGGPGTVRVGQSSISTGSPIAIPSGVTLVGMGPPTAGATPATTLTYTGTGTTPFITANSTAGPSLKNLMVLYSSSSFTGRLVDLSDSGAGNTAFAAMSDVYLGGASGIRTADCLLYIANTHSLRFDRVQFRSGAVHGVRGKTLSTDTANAITFNQCYFNDNTTTHIRNPGDGWVFIGCTGEPLHGGVAGFIACDTNFGSNGCTFIGGWMGDVTSGAGGIQVDFTGNNLVILGTLIGGNTSSTGVKLRNNSGVAPAGISIAAHFNGPTTGIDFAGVAPIGYDFSRSSFTNVTTPFSGGTSASISIDVASGIPAIVKRNRSTVDSRVVDRYQSDMTSSYTYDVGLDPDGSAFKRWGVRDITRNAIVWFVDKLGNVVAGASGADLATSATDGFFYLPTVNGTPTGSPTAYTGAVPAVVDRSTNKLYVRVGGTWKSVTLT